MQVLTSRPRGAGRSSEECLMGARIHEVKMVTEKTQKFENDLLVIQVSGNNLERVGAEVVEAVKAAGGKNLSVAIMGVIR